MEQLAEEWAQDEAACADEQARMEEQDELWQRELANDALYLHAWRRNFRLSSFFSPFFLLFYYLSTTPIKKPSGGGPRGVEPLNLGVHDGQLQLHKAVSIAIRVDVTDTSVADPVCVAGALLDYILCL